MAKSDPEWRLRARCIGQGFVFFDEHEDSIEKAKQTCRRCPVSQECRAEARAHPPSFGVWAGEVYRPASRRRRRGSA